jgi:hypothetical protein
MGQSNRDTFAGRADADGVGFRKGRIIDDGREHAFTGRG